MLFRLNPSVSDPLTACRRPVRTRPGVPSRLLFFVRPAFSISLGSAIVELEIVSIGPDGYPLGACSERSAIPFPPVFPAAGPALAWRCTVSSGTRRKSAASCGVRISGSLSLTNARTPPALGSDRLSIAHLCSASGGSTRALAWRRLTPPPLRCKGDEQSRSGHGEAIARCSGISEEQPPA